MNRERGGWCDESIVVGFEILGGSLWFRWSGLRGGFRWRFLLVAAWDSEKARGGRIPGVMSLKGSIQTSGGDAGDGSVGVVCVSGFLFSWVGL